VAPLVVPVPVPLPAPLAAEVPPPVLTALADPAPWPIPMAMPPPAVPITLPVKSYEHVHISAHLQFNPLFELVSPAHKHGFKHAHGAVIVVGLFPCRDLDSAEASLLKKKLA
jgi:hypothetical protein